METIAYHTLYVYSCRSGHKLLRQSEAKELRCSRCPGATLMTLLHSVPRNDGESDHAFNLRALMKRKERVN